MYTYTCFSGLLVNHLHLDHVFFSRLCEAKTPNVFCSDVEEFMNQFSDISKDEQMSRLHGMLAPHMLRRLKVDVLKDIPAKAEFLVRVDMAPMQK